LHKGAVGAKPHFGKGLFGTISISMVSLSSTLYVGMVFAHGNTRVRSPIFRSKKSLNHFSMKKVNLQIVFLLILVLFLNCSESNRINHVLVGEAFGTTFTVKYHPKKDGVKKTILANIEELNNSLSTYQGNSIISKINRNEDVIVDFHFKKVFKKSKEIYRNTHGAFDPTVGLLVNTWGFGPDGFNKNIDSLEISGLLSTIGFDKIHLADNKVIKENKDTYLDFNSIAKGYAVDVFSNSLKKMGIKNFMVEVGGEVRARGKNVEKNKPWLIGIETPDENSRGISFATLELENAAMATSGTYRKFRTDSSGNRINHIINPITGYPTETRLISVSVISDTCMESDAYATALFVLDPEMGKEIIKEQKLEGFLIYKSSNGNVETYKSPLLKINELQKGT